MLYIFFDILKLANVSGGIKTTGISKQNSEANICVQEGREWGMVTMRTSYLYCSHNIFRIKSRRWTGHVARTEVARSTLKF